MKTVKKLFIAMIVCLYSATNSNAQDTLAIQGFESYDTSSYVVNPTPYNAGMTIWDSVPSIWLGMTSLAPASGTNFWGMQDLNNMSGGGNFFHTLDFGPYDISSYVFTTLSFKYYTTSFDQTDTIQYIIEYDNGTTWGTAVPLNKNTTAWTTVSINIPKGTNYVRLRLEARQDGTWDAAGFDDIEIIGYTADNIPPVVNGIEVVNTSTIHVIFSEPVNTTAESISNYSFDYAVISNIVRTPSHDTAVITLSTPIQNGVADTLTISNVQDTASNPLVAPQSFDIFQNTSIEDIVITEIMYNDPSTGMAGDSLEFIELYNNGSTVANIGGYLINMGVNYMFPSNTTINAGEYLVIARNSDAVDNFFGITGTLQWTSGNLPNNGGTAIRIVNTVGDVIDSVTYSDISPWPTAADGTGPSLTLCDPNTDNSDVANWTVSTVYVGIVNSMNVYATPDDGCPIPLLVTDAYATSLTKIKVVFNKQVNFTAGNTANYTGIGSITTALRSASLDTVTLTLSTPLVSGIYDTLTISNVEDIDNVAMAAPQSFPIIFGTPVYPVVLDAYATSLSTVEVVFDKPMDFTAENPANYTGLGTINLAIRCATLDTVTLTLAVPLTTGIYDTLTIDNVQDTSSIQMLTAQSFQIVYGTPVYPFVVDAYATSLSTVIVAFNKAVSYTAENPANYTGLGTISLAIRNATLDTVTLTLATPLTSGVPETLTIANVYDTANHAMAAPQDFVVVYGTSGITDVEKTTLSCKIYPNPFTDEVVVELINSVHTPVYVRITDISGKVISEQEIQVNKLRTGNNLPVGIYLLQVTDAQGQRAIYKLVKTK